MADVFILGCGYCGRRTARLLLASGHRVWGTSRRVDGLAELEREGLEALAFDAGQPGALERLELQVPRGCRLLYSIPTLSSSGGPWEPAPEIFDALGDRSSRVVYLSTSGVYGAQLHVDEHTATSPHTERQKQRVAAEAAAQAGDWQTLILRPAAIYGPGRGVHVALPRGDYKLVGDGANHVSRIHVDDLAAITAAALLSDQIGAYPVADEDPATSREIAAFCAGLLEVPAPESVSLEQVSETRRADRQVDGRAIRNLLGVELRYPSFRQGIPAALADE